MEIVRLGTVLLHHIKLDIADRAAAIRGKHPIRWPCAARAGVIAISAASVIRHKNPGIVVAIPRNRHARRAILETWVTVGFVQLGHVPVPGLHGVALSEVK